MCCFHGPGGAAFAPVVLCALYYSRTNIHGAIAGMLGGFLTSVVWVLFFKSAYYNLYEMIPGFIVGLVLTILVSELTQKSFSETSKGSL